MNRAVFFDRDGVINDNSNAYYVYRVEDLKINPGIIELMQKLYSRGFLIFIVSNQGGIAKGIYTQKEADQINHLILEKLQEENIEVSDILYCPHHDSKGRCLCRKPDSLMIERLISLYRIDAGSSFLIGDSKWDIQAGEKVGLKAKLVRSNMNLKYLDSQIL